MDRASELGVACQVPNMPANSRSTPRQLPAPAGFTGGLPGRVPPAAAASLGSRGVSSRRDAVTSEMAGL